MSNPDRRKQLKAKKERLQAKKHSQLQKRERDAESFVRADLTTQLLSLVTSGRARIAVATIVESRTVLAAMWDNEGVQVRAYNAKEEASLNILATAAGKHVSIEEWADFMSHHLEAVVNTEGNQYALSMVEWKPGEGPASHSSPTQG